MGSGGVPNRGVDVTYEKKLKITGKPNSRIDRYNSNDEKVQSRWYDKSGNAIRNRDYGHGGSHEFPHDHSWDWSSGKGTRGTEHLIPDYDNYF